MLRPGGADSESQGSGPQKKKRCQNIFVENTETQRFSSWMHVQCNNVQLKDASHRQATGLSPSASHAQEDKVITLAPPRPGESFLSETAACNVFDNAWCAIQTQHTDVSSVQRLVWTSDASTSFGEEAGILQDPILGKIEYHINQIFDGEQLFRSICELQVLRTVCVLVFTAVTALQESSELP